jgi:hypothetical protein
MFVDGCIYDFCHAVLYFTQKSVCDGGHIARV